MIGLCTLSIGDGRTSNFITSHAKSNRSQSPARSQQEKPSPSIPSHKPDPSLQLKPSSESVIEARPTALKVKVSEKERQYSSLPCPPHPWPDRRWHE